MPFPTFDSADAVPEAFRDEYEEQGGKWVPRDDLKTALDAERTKREAAEKLATKAAGELKKLQAKQEAEKAGLTDEQAKNLRASVRAELEEEYAPKIADRDTLATENRTIKLDNAVKALMDTSGVRPERKQQLWDLHGKDFDLTADGKPMVKDSPGVEVTKYIGDTLKAKVPEFFTGTQIGGGGAGGITNGLPTPAAPAASPVERLAAAHAAGAKS